MPNRGESVTFADGAVDEFLQYPSRERLRRLLPVVLTVAARCSLSPENTLRVYWLT